MHVHLTPLILGGLGATELLIILAVVVLLFGATKLPELARGSGRALRIFKAETTGLMDDDDDVGPEVAAPVAPSPSVATSSPVGAPAPVTAPAAVATPEPVVEPRPR